MKSVDDLARWLPSPVEPQIALMDITPGKLAEAELHFTGGELDGLKLVGFAVWEARNGGSRYVSLPARQFAVNGDRRSFVLLRSIEDPKAQDRLRERVLRAYVAYASETENAIKP